MLIDGISLWVAELTIETTKRVQDGSKCKEKRMLVSFRAAHMRLEVQEVVFGVGGIVAQKLIKGVVKRIAPGLTRFTESSLSALSVPPC
jgi:hypothetical protein